MSFPALTPVRGGSAGKRISRQIHLRGGGGRMQGWAGRPATSSCAAGWSSVSEGSSWGRLPLLFCWFFVALRGWLRTQDRDAGWHPCPSALEVVGLRAGSGTRPLAHALPLTAHMCVLTRGFTHCVCMYVSGHTYTYVRRRYPTDVMPRDILHMGVGGRGCRTFPVRTSCWSLSLLRCGGSSSCMPNFAISSLSHRKGACQYDARVPTVLSLACVLMSVPSPSANPPYLHACVICFDLP